TLPAPPHIFTLSLHDALPISPAPAARGAAERPRDRGRARPAARPGARRDRPVRARLRRAAGGRPRPVTPAPGEGRTLDEGRAPRSEEHTSELQSRENLVCRLL